MTAREDIGVPVVSLRIEKLNYSAKPWRVLDENGQQLHQWVPYPGNDQLPRIRQPLCFGTKAEAVDAVCRIAAHGLRLRERVRLYLEARKEEESSVIGGCLTAMSIATRGWDR